MQKLILYDNKVIELETPICTIGTPLVISSVYPTIEFIVNKFFGKP